MNDVERQELSQPGGNQLQVAIDALYVAFQTPKPLSILGCPCCLNKDDVGVLLTRKLRMITPEELAPYASSVFLTVGGEADFRYFLPRIFKIAVLDKSWWPSPEVSIRTLRLACWETWSPQQQQAIRNFLSAWLEERVRCEPTDPFEICELICGIGRVEDNMEPYLNQVFNHPSALATYFEFNLPSLQSEGKLWNSFWEDTPSRGLDVIEFLRSDRVQRQLGDRSA